MSKLMEQTLLLVLQQQTMTNMLLVEQLEQADVGDDTLTEKLEIAVENATTALTFVVEQTIELETGS